ncbi:MAG: hypothetical protein DRG59_06400 [Deltaproteobacteria bacterium]|nr:MAG: hypothetical protein DRG59_06400 [Deltaproteobacteria bacterium]
MHTKKDLEKDAALKGGNLMLESLCIPFIKKEVVKRGKYQTVAAWKLSNVLAMDLAFSQFLPKEPGVDQTGEKFSYLDNLYKNRAAFARAISSWPSNIIVELNMVSIPHLEWKLKGEVQYSFLLRVFSGSRGRVLTMALKYATIFQGLLNSCFPEVEFTPVKDPKVLGNICKPFTPNRATLILRHREHINIAESLAKNKIGFVVSLGEAKLEDPAATYSFPWTVNPLGHERLIQYLLWSSYPVWISVKLRASQSVEEETQAMKKVVEECDAYITGAVTSKQVYVHQLSVLQKLLFRRSLELNEGALLAQLAFYTLEEPDCALLNLVGESVTGKSVEREIESFFNGSFRIENVNVKRALDPFYFYEKESFSTEEAISVIQIPYPPRNDSPGFTVKRFRSAFANIPEEISESQDRILLGNSVHRGIKQPVYCRIKDRLKHMFIIGMTGTGKSTFMENLILQDIRKGYGLCLIDPHGELVEQILGKIPENRHDDVILFDPLDTECAVGFNILEWKTIQERDLIIDNLYQTLDQIYDMRTTGGPIFEHNFRNMLKLLMGDRRRRDFSPTLFYFPTLYLNGAFRSWLEQSIEDRVVKNFLRELERTSGEAHLSNIAPYVTSKFGRFVSDTILKRIVGQRRSTIDIEKIFEEGKILLVNLGKGRFGSTVSSLLTSQIITRFRNAAMKRAEIPGNKRTPFFLYVDEFQNVNSDDFVELLAEARKYGLGLILANQFTITDRQKKATAVSLCSMRFWVTWEPSWFLELESMMRQSFNRCFIPISGIWI